MFESVKTRLEKLLRDHTRSDPRAYTSALREALLEAKVGVSTMRSALVKSEEELRREQRQLSDAERRGRLALEVPDQKTVTLAQQFAQRHRERIAVLERKISVQRDELVLAEREVEEMLGQVRGGSTGADGDSLRAAWRDIQAAGGDHPDAAPDDERLRSEADSKLKDMAVDAQLAFLKKKFGKQNNGER
jgi:hypothetical protein